VILLLRTKAGIYIASHCLPSRLSYHCRHLGFPIQIFFGKYRCCVSERKIDFIVYHLLSFTIVDMIMRTLKRYKNVWPLHRSPTLALLLIGEPAKVLIKFPYEWVEAKHDITWSCKQTFIGPLLQLGTIISQWWGYLLPLHGDEHRMLLYSGLLVWARIGCVWSSSSSPFPWCIPGRYMESIEAQITD